MVVSWHATQGWLLHAVDVDGPETVERAARIRLLGPVTLVRTADKAWAECDGYAVVEQ